MTERVTTNPLCDAVVPHETLSIGDYHRSQHLSHSALRAFYQIGPEAFHDCHVTRTVERPRKFSAALSFGSAFDAYVTERRVFDRYYAIKDALPTEDESAAWTESHPEVSIKPEGMSFATKAGKSWKADQQAALDAEMVARDLEPTKVQPMSIGDANKAIVSDLNEGKTVISRDDMDRIVAMNDSMLAVEDLNSGEVNYQPTYMHAHKSLPEGIMLQSRPDLVRVNAGRIVDVKTTSKWDKWWSTYSPGIDHGYWTQQSMGWRFGEMIRPRVELLVVESVYPYRSMLVEIKSDALELGWRWVEATTRAIGERMHEGNWEADDRTPPALQATAQMETEVLRAESGLLF